MVTRKFSKLVMIVLLAATVAGTAAAQDGGKGQGGHGGRDGMGMGRRGPGALVEIVQKVSDETQLTAREITQDLLSGQTVAEILNANSKDPEAFVTAMLADAKTKLSEQVTAGNLTQAQADERLTQSEADLRAFVFEGTLPEGRDGQKMGNRIVQLGQIIVEQAGLDAKTVMESLKSGKTLETLITEAGKDVATVKQASIDAATKAINEAVTAGTVTQERADQMIANLSTVIDRLLSGNMPTGQRGGLRLGAAVATATGMTPQEVKAQVDAGKTLADVLTSKNIAIDSFVETQLQPVKDRLTARVTSGEITQALVDARLALARVEMTDRLNGTFKAEDGAEMPDAPMEIPEATTTPNA